MRAPSSLSLAIAVACTGSPVAAQATVEGGIPDAARVAVHPVGASTVVRASRGMELLPGDLLVAVDSTDLELRCAGTGTRYRLSGPFRVLVDVPVDAECHVNLLEGEGNILAESPTNTTVGGIPLISAGTQYSVRVRREGDELVRICTVFDGNVHVRGSERQIGAGSMLLWDRAGVRRARISRRELDRSASVYARFDLAAALPDGPPDEAPEAGEVMYTRLKALHFEVLANPGDTAKRVNLARQQLEYRIMDQARYNLERAQVLDDASLRRYDIDPAAVRAPARDTVGPAAEGRLTERPLETPDVREGVRPEVQARLRPEALRAREAVAYAPASPSTTDGDLRLLAAGRVDEAVRNLEARIRTGTATSRDHFALAKAWALRGDAARVTESAARALVLHADDEALSPQELRELGQLLSRGE